MIVDCSTTTPTRADREARFDDAKKRFNKENPRKPYVHPDTFYCRFDNSRFYIVAKKGKHFTRFDLTLQEDESSIRQRICKENVDTPTPAQVRSVIAKYEAWQAFAGIMQEENTKYKTEREQEQRLEVKYRQAQRECQEVLSLLSADEKGLDELIALMKSFKEEKQN